MVAAALAEPLVADAKAPIAEAADDADDAAAAAPTPATTPPNPNEDPTVTWPTYLLQFMHRFLDMREAEAQACAALAGVPRELLPLDLPPRSTRRRGSFYLRCRRLGRQLPRGGPTTRRSGRSASPDPRQQQNC